MSRQMHFFRLLIAIAMLAGAGGAFAANPATKPASTQAAKSPTTKKTTFEAVIRGRIAEPLADLDRDNDFAKAKEKLTAIFDQVILNAPDKSDDLFRDADFALRFVTHLQAYDPKPAAEDAGDKDEGEKNEGGKLTSGKGERGKKSDGKEEAKKPELNRLSLMKYLRANESLARTVAFLVREDQEKPEQVYAMLDRLRSERPKLVNKYVFLTAAICVVHDQPLVRHVNENLAEAVDPVEIFDYYVKNENKMFFGIKNVPPELLIYVVDTTAKVEEMRWALTQYSNNATIGTAFFDVPYDYENFLHGTEKKITTLGFNLPNIRKYGGVCADQAYFASSVGKAIGVPSCYVWGAAGVSAHAWVGYLANQGKRGAWNFDEGRYDAYKGVRGNVLDPQTRQEIPDSYVSLLAEMIGSRTEERQDAVAYTDAAKRLTELEEKLESYADVKAEEIPGAPPKPRSIDTASEMALLDAGLRQNLAYTPGWLTLREMAAAKKLTLDQKRVVADALLKECGKYPDFTFDILKPMIETIPDANEQNKIWNAAFAMFQNRADLAGAARMAQADLWESKGDTAKAGQCYEDVINRFTNSGPFIIEALQRAERLLIQSGKSSSVATLYEQAWKKIPRPATKAADPFLHQSNWYRVGQIYAQKLQQSGQLAKSDQVMLMLDGGNNANPREH